MAKANPLRFSTKYQDDESDMVYSPAKRTKHAASQKENSYQFYLESMKSIKFLLFAIVAVSLSGCDAESKSLNARLAYAIQFERENVSAGDKAVSKRIKHAVLSALLHSSVKTLSNPAVAYSLLVQENGNNLNLYVWWIEAHPSVNQVEIKFSDDSAPVKLPISDQDLRLIRSNESKTVLYGAEFSFQNGVPLWEELNKIFNARNLGLRLLHEDGAVTGWSPIEFYKLDHWVSR